MNEQYDNVPLNEFFSCSLRPGRSCVYHRALTAQHSSGDINITITRANEKEWIATGAVTAAAPNLLVPGTGPCDGGDLLENYRSCAAHSNLDFKLSGRINVALPTRVSGIRWQCQVNQTGVSAISSFSMESASGEDVTECAMSGPSVDGNHVVDVASDAAGIAFEFDMNALAAHVVTSNPAEAQDEHGRINMNVVQLRITVP